MHRDCEEQLRPEGMGYSPLEGERGAAQGKQGSAELSQNSRVRPHHLW